MKGQIEGAWPVYRYRGYCLRHLPARPGYEITKEGAYIDTQNETLPYLCLLIDRTLQEGIR